MIIKTVGMLCKHTSIIIKYSVFLVHYIGVCSRKILDERFFGVNAGLPGVGAGQSHTIRYSIQTAFTSNLRRQIIHRGS